MSRRRAPTESPDVERGDALAHSRALMALLGQRYVQFYPVLAELTGSVKAALLLGQALYWTRSYLIEHPERDNWFWYTAREWQASTGLSRREQENARRNLIAHGYVLQRRIGMPARLHFKVNLDALGCGLARHLDGGGELSWQWDNARLRRLLGRPVAFFRPLATVSGSVNAGLYLSHLCMSLRAMALHGEADGLLNPQGWMDVPVQASARRLCLGVKGLRTARLKLISSGLVEERWGQGMPARKLTRIAQGLLAQRLCALGAAAPAPLDRPQTAQCGAMADSASAEWPKSGNSNGAFAHSRVAQSAKQQWRKRASQGGPKRQTVMAETAISEWSKAPNMIRQMDHSIKASSTQNYLSLLLPSSPIEGDSRCLPKKRSGQANPEPEAQDGAGGAPSALIWAQNIPAGERDVAGRILERAEPSQRQLLLDEWVGQRRNAAKAMPNPLGYLVGLVEAARLNRFVPTLALAVAEGRERQARSAASREAALALPTAPGASSEYGDAASSPTRTNRLPEQVGRQLDEFRRKLACRR